MRDIILGKNPKDLDFVVVGKTPLDLINLGFREVGFDFPVFLHPKTRNEFALARREKKTGKGHRGFYCETGNISLQEDLKRRDLSFNAMAMDSDGNIIDYFNGESDLKNGICRHISENFSDDPLRVLRVARFASCFDFSVHPATLEKMKSLKEELSTLTSERVAMEMFKALETKNPRIFFEVLKSCDALEVVFPELHSMIGIPSGPYEHHQEDCFEHTMMVLEESVKRRCNIKTRFACLTHDFGKIATLKTELPKHIDHDIKGIPIVDSFCKKMRVKNSIKKFAIASCKNHLKIHRALESRPGTIVKLLNSFGVRHGIQNIVDLVEVCICDSMGRVNENEKRARDTKRAGAFVITSAARVNTLKIDTRNFEGEKAKNIAHGQMCHVVRETRKAFD